MKRALLIVSALLMLCIPANAVQIPAEFEDLFSCYQMDEKVALPSGNEVTVRDVEYCSYAEFIGAEDPEEKYPPYYVAIETEYKNNSDKPISGAKIAENCNLAVYAWPYLHWNGWLIWEEEFYTEYEEGCPLPIEMTPEYIFRMTDEYNDKRVLNGYNKWDELVPLDEVEVQPGESVVFVDLMNIVSPDEVVECEYCLAYSVREGGKEFNIRVNEINVQYSAEESVITEERIHSDVLYFSLIDFPTYDYWWWDREESKEEVAKVIKEYQRQNSLPVTGNMDELTYAYLYKEVEMD